MPPRPDTSNSLMMQSGKDNKLKLTALGEIYQNRRYNEGDTTNYEEEGKNKAKKFSFFRWIFKKTKSNMGRFIPELKQKEDSISAMEGNDNVPKGAYFDPLGLKVIKPKVVEDFGAEDQEAFEQAESEAADIERDFVSRVDSEITNISENDYEENLMDENSELALAQYLARNRNIPGATLENMAEAYNAGRAYTPEPGYIEDIPDDFQIEMKVTEVPPKYTLEWQQYRAEHTQGFTARISRFFKSFFVPKVPDDEYSSDLENSFILSLPEYKQIISEGQRNARLMKIKYEPDKDPAVLEFKHNTYMATKAANGGHALIKLIAKKGGRDLSTYSFDFASIANSGMAGAVRGAITNPANDSEEGAVKARQNIKYSGYLKAAAKIRGVSGAMKAYSYLRYNCASFAAQVAQAAGVDIKPEDTTRKIMTLRHRSERVETPYDFANYIRRLNEKNPSEESELSEEAVAALDEKNQKIQDLTDGYYRRYEGELANNKTAEYYENLGFITMDEVRSGFERKIKEVVSEGLKIDEKYPVGEGEGEASSMALGNRAREKMLTIGAATEDQAIQRMLAPENHSKAFFAFIDRNIGVEDVRRFFRNIPTSVSGINNYMEVIKRIQESEYFEKRYPNLPDPKRLGHRIGYDIYEKVVRKQAEIMQSILDACEGKTNQELIDTFGSAMGQYEAKLFSWDVMFSEADLDRFAELSRIELPKRSDYVQDEEPVAENKPEEKPAPVENAPKKRTVFGAKAASTMVRRTGIEGGDVVDNFLTVFVDAAGIEGRSTKASRAINQISDLNEFFVQAAATPELRDDVYELYDAVMDESNENGKLQFYRDFFQKVVAKLNSKKLATLMSNSEIE